MGNWESNVTIPREQLGGNIEHKSSQSISDEAFKRFYTAGVVAQQILAHTYPYFESDLKNFYPAIQDDDIATIRADALHIPVNPPIQHITKIPQKYGAPHVMKIARFEQPNFFIVLNDSESKRTSKTPENRYVAPFSVYSEYAITVSQFEPDSHLVRRIYPISGIVQTIFDPYVAERGHKDWEKAQYFPGFSGESSVKWDESSELKLKGLNMKIAESIWSHRQEQATNMFYAVQAKGMSGKG